MSINDPLSKAGACLMRCRLPSLLVAGSLIALSGCSGEENTAAGVSKAAALSVPKTVGAQRWYSQAQIAKGDALFQTHCASCHKPDASGSPTWRESDTQGKYPPPPLNGTAHTWHHPLSMLRRTVRVGGVPLGGSMPGFAAQLNAEEIDAILAWVQSHWSDEIYGIWHERNAQASRLRPPSKKG